MTGTVRIDASHRVMLSDDLRRAAGFSRNQKLKVFATPGRIVLEAEAISARIVKEGELKVWTGNVPSIPLEQAVARVRSHQKS